MASQHIKIEIKVMDNAPQTCGVDCPFLKLAPLTGGAHGCSLFDYPLNALRHYDGPPFNRGSLWQRTPQCLAAIPVHPGYMGHKVGGP